MNLYSKAAKIPDEPCQSKQLPRSSLSRILNEDTVRLELQKLVWGENPIFTVKDLALVIGKHERQAYHILEGERKPTCEDLILIGREAMLRGEPSIAELMLPNGYAIMPCEDQQINGSLDDEIAEMTEDLGSAHSKFARGKYHSALKDITDLKMKVARMEAEVTAKL